MKITLMALVLILAVVAGQAYADQIIVAPTGRTLGLGQAKVEGAVMADDTDNNIEWANVGLPRVELQALRVENQAGDSGTGFGVQMSILPETIVTPAISIGARDVTDETSFGRAVYVAVGKTVPLIGRAGLPIKSIKLDGGLGTGNLNGLFGGVEIGFPYHLTGYAEWDGEEFNGAVGWTPINHVQLKAYWIDGDLFYGGRLSIGL